ncbi:translation initiation factor IF-2 [Sporosalibacterium faouarense]|uniref:translation initiation factor IF-2 n=1 Tax=Sporosalibacterium faouarense TaxID=516123 RepID=UPI00141CE733|nr:translation initiation factor IF-2 [Sporosalibacterium faouarense]MTI48038.1 translation initiation factor IF-2 [Bacillota bacterium]
MTKIRVYELAKELNLSSKELIEKLNELDLEIGSHMSTIEDEEVKVIKELLGDNNKGTNDDDLEDKKKMENKQKKQKRKKITKEKTKKSGDSRMNDKTNNKTNDKTNESKDSMESQENLNEIEIGESVIVGDLAEKMNINANQIISKLIGLGVMASINQEIDFDTASVIAEEFDFLATKEEENNDVMEESPEDLGLDFEDDEKDLKSRPPVVTVMGHVDHGKTSLLDSIRETHVTNSEAGGITQHIGASTVRVNNKKIVFLDTPGHEAFTSMRARGAQVTDIAILVVAADDGVMPQTVEAINHAKAAGVPIIVAVNKIDKEQANPDRVKQELTEHGLVPEDWGGETICVPVSAITKEGMDELLEMVLLVAEMQELKANPNRNVKGVIIEAKLDKGRGSVATVLVQKGTLKVGDSIVAGVAHGKVRAMFDDKGKKVKKAIPSTPVEILGLSEVPNAGEFLYSVEDDKKAREIAELKKEHLRDEQINSSTKVSLDDLFDKISEGEVQDLNIIIKADVSGSIEAVKQSLLKLSHEEVRVNPIHGGVGAITDTDIMLASASNAIIIGFNVRPTSSALSTAETEKVDVRTYRIIYKAIEDVEAAIKGMLAPEFKEVIMGRAEVRATFKVPNAGIVAGVYVQEGKITRKSSLRLLRDNVVIHEGEISSLKRFKDDVRELQTGYEGGVGIENYNDVKEGDVIEAYIMEEVAR